MLQRCKAPPVSPNGAKEVEPPTMLTKADRNTRVMVNTPTRVLFILDRTIFLERVCRGPGKSWEGGEEEGERYRTEFSGHSTTATEPDLPSPLSLAS